MTPGDLEHEDVTPKSWYKLDIARKTPVHKFGEPRLTVLSKFCWHALISKTMNPGDLENEVVTPKS